MASDARLDGTSRATEMSIRILSPKTCQNYPSFFTKIFPPQVAIERVSEWQIFSPFYIPKFSSFGYSFQVYPRFGYPSRRRRNKLENV